MQVKVSLDNRIYKTAILLLSILFITQNVWSQKFYVKASAKEVPQNYTFDITYTVENGDVDDFKAPKFDNFDTYGPSQSQNINVINGRVSKSISFTYTLQPKNKAHLYFLLQKHLLMGK